MPPSPSIDSAAGLCAMDGVLANKLIRAHQHQESTHSDTLAAVYWEVDAGDELRFFAGQK